MHIAVAGNIGCGKTTLTTMLAKRKKIANPDFIASDLCI